MAALNELAILIHRLFKLDLGYIHCKWSLNHLSIGNGLPFTGPDTSIVSLIHCNIKESDFLITNDFFFFFEDFIGSKQYAYLKWATCWMQI